MITPSFSRLTPGASDRIVDREYGRSIDPAPDLPVTVLIDTPPCISLLHPAEINMLISDQSDAAFAFTPYRTRYQTALPAFLEKITNCISYQRKAYKGLDALLKYEMSQDLEEENEDFLTHDDIIKRSVFRQEIAWAIFSTVSGLGLYRNGYLFYSVTKITPTAIVLSKTIL